MEFLTDAIHSPAAAALTPTWDGRDDDDDADQLFDRAIEHDDVLSIIASRDEEDKADSVDTIMQKKTTSSSCYQHGVGKLAVKLMNKPRNNNSDNEPVSPHVPVEDHVEQASCTKQYVRAMSNLLNLSDLEHSLNVETSTLKDLMMRTKYERDQLHYDNIQLKKQLAHHQMLVEAEGGGGSTTEDPISVSAETENVVEMTDIMILRAASRAIAESRPKKRNVVCRPRRASDEATRGSDGI
jgi:hypothetical protein